MKKLLTLAMLSLSSGAKLYANPEAEKLSQRPKYALVMRKNADGTKTLFKVEASQKWSESDLKRNVAKIADGKMKAQVAKIQTKKSDNEDAEKGGITSWYWNWGYGYYSPCRGNWWGNNYWYNNNYGWGWGQGSWGYGYYYTLWYQPVVYRSVTYYYYY